MKNTNIKSIHTIMPNSSKLLWMSDLHLDQSNQFSYEKLLYNLNILEYDAAVITGDTAASESLAQHLNAITDACYPKPVYIVLGNHDFYNSSIKKTKIEVGKICKSISNVYHLQEYGPIWINNNTILLGHHGWPDAQCGWGVKTIIDSPDFNAIDDFRPLDKRGQFNLMGRLGFESTRFIRKNLNAFLSKSTKIIVATHVPPFLTSAYYNGKLCGRCHSPHYVNSNMGGMLIGKAQERKNHQKRFIVLSGHTHSGVRDFILPNLESRVASAVRGYPRIQGIFTI